jgi:Fe-S oxidoreductase
MLRPDLPIDHTAWLTPELITAEQSETLLYVGCAPYHDAFFPNLDVKNLDAARGAVKILNHLGIQPMVMKDERCCGHDAYWEGNQKRFQQLARQNKERIEETDAKEIIFTCPECMHAIRDLYAQAGLQLKMKMRHITEVIAENSESLNLQALPQKVTFQDPCRLARNMGNTSSARDAMNTIPGLELTEMAHSGAAATCCAGKWSHCDAQTKQIQNGRLREATRTGADLLVTACPKCEVHLKCAMQGNADLKFEVRDLTTLVADALPEPAPELFTSTESVDSKDTPRV